MIEKSSNRKVSIITEIILLAIVMTVVTSLFCHFNQKKINDSLQDGKFAYDNFIIDKRNESNIETENKMYLKNIRADYGIKVKFGKEIEEFAKKVNATAQYDKNIVNQNLKGIYEALSKYPMDVFEMSKSKKYPITIILLDTFHDDNLALAARTRTNEFRLYISNTEKFERAFHHEMYHLIEYYMADTRRNLYDSWNELNPLDFKYQKDISKLNNDYVFASLTGNLMDEESLKQDVPGENNEVEENNPYFVTMYSKVTQKEDRAEIFAEMMISTKKPKYLYRDQNIRKKAELMNETIIKNVTSQEFFYTKYLK